MSALADFQQAFADALRAETGVVASVGPVRGFASDPAFAVYRNTVTKGWVDALEANFPAVVAVVGEQWFRAAATAYARRTPPSDPVLARYGDTFPTFLARFEPASEMPYLPHVATLDRLWSESACAEDGPFLQAADLAGVDAQQLAQAPLRLHPAVRFVWIRTTAPSIWLDARGFEAPADGLRYQERGEGLLLARPAEEVTPIRLTSGGYRLVERLDCGDSFGAAAEQALLREPRLDLATLFATLLASGVFSAAEFANAGEGP